MAYTRKDYAGGAAETTIVGDLTSGSLSISTASATGWPTGSNGPFVVVIDAGTASEEKVLVTSRSSTVLTVASSGDRGYDGTTATSHASGATIEHCIAATDLDEANYAVAQTVGKVTAAGDLLAASAANTFARVAKGSNSTVFGVDSGGTQGYATIATAQVADSAVTNAKLAGMTRGTVKVGNSSGVASDLALGTSGYYLKSNGTDAVWASIDIDGWTTLTKAGDESVSGSTALQDDDELLFTASSGTLYAVEAFIIYASPSGAGTPDIKFAFGESGTTTGAWTAVTLTTSDAAGSVSGVLTNGTDTSTAGSAATKRAITMYGSHVGAGGSFKFRWAQNTSNGNNLTVYTGSYLRYKAIP